MKNLVAIALMTLYSLNYGYAQNANRKIKEYRTWITTDTIPLKTSGILYEVKAFSIVLVNSVTNQDYSDELFKKVEINVSNIEKIKIRRKNKSGRAALFGAASGLAVGILIGVISGDDPGSRGPGFNFTFTATEKAIAAGIPLAALGAGAGALLGSVKVQVPLHSLNKLKAYSIKQQLR
jgi:hypothetical protein